MNYMNRLFALLNTPQALNFILLITAILFSPSIATGLLTDDLYHYFVLNGDFSLNIKDDISLFGLFSFVTDDINHRTTLMNNGMLTWWTKPEFTWQFWRPVSEISHYIDYRLFSDFPWLMHIHSIVLFLLIIVLLNHFLSLIKIHLQLAMMLLLIFALNCSHAITVSWLANRSSLLACLFGILTLILHFHATHRIIFYEKMRLYILSLTSLAFCLLSGEIGLSVGGFLLGYALFLDTNGYKKGIISILPYLIIVLGWYYIYNSHNMGLKGSSWGYIDPKAYPDLFIDEFKIRFPLVVTSSLSSLPVDAFSFMPSLPHQAAVKTGYALSLALFLVIPFIQQHKLYCFFLTGLFISIIPTTINPPEARNMIFVSIASAGIISIFILQLLYVYKTSKEKICKILSQWLILLLLTINIVISPLLIPLGAYIPKLFSSYNNILAKSLSISQNDKLVIFGLDNPMYFLPQMAVNQEVLPAKMWGITNYNDKFTSRKLSDHEILLTSNDGFFSSNDPSWLKRSQIVDFSKSTTFILDGLTIEILSINPTGFPTAMKLVFTETLEHYTFLKRKGNGFEKLDMNNELSFGP